MALIKFGPMVLDARGSVGGVTFTRNASGAIIRARVKPVNPNTERQDNVRSAMALLTNNWSQILTAGQRTAWNLYASSVAMKNKLGEAIFNSGFNHYIRSNSWLATLGAPTVDDGPIVFSLPTQDPGLSVAISEATNIWTITFNDGQDWVSEDGANLILYNGKPQNAQRNFFGGPWQFMNSIAGNSIAPPASPLDRAASFTYSELQRAWVYARVLMADGRISEPFEANCYVAA